jgi:hypothetical protein
MNSRLQSNLEMFVLSERNIGGLLPRDLGLLPGISKCVSKNTPHEDKSLVSNFSIVSVFNQQILTFPDFFM